jgi:hypothetical protein
MQAKHIPPDFTDEASYLAYLKAVAAGQVRIYGQDQAEAQAMARAELTGQTRAACEFSSAKPNIAERGDCTPHMRRDGTWEPCNGFLDLAILRATP